MLNKIFYPPISYSNTFILFEKKIFLKQNGIETMCSGFQLTFDALRKIHGDSQQPCDHYHVPGNEDIPCRGGEVCVVRLECGLVYAGRAGENR